jgi:hypothetical protein
VFAYEYRPWSSTAHGYHADLVFSRTGITRVGTVAEAWDGAWRRFRGDPPGLPGIAVTPARYAAFLAEARRPLAADPVIGRRDERNDPRRTFLFPVHKLFSGHLCVAKAMITLDFKEYHRNEKLKRIHAAGGVKAAKGFDINKPPFLRDSKNTNDLVALRRVGDSVLVVAQSHQLVRAAEQKNSVSRKNEIARFLVPPGTDANRFSSSLQLPTKGIARIAPEFVNIRHRVVQRSKGADVTIDDMQPLPETKFNAVLKAGKYEAVHFIDDTCDGAVVAVVGGLPVRRQNFPAYSLVTAPDFFPLADQLEVANWVRHDLKNRQEQFAQGAPWPLCEGRRPANLELPRPGVPSRKAFDRNDETVVAVVGPRPLSTQTHAPDRKKRFASFLPDAASNEFEPGWDVSLVRDDVGLYYAAYGLGSPFLEDAKLCERNDDSNGRLQKVYHEAAAALSDLVGRLEEADKASIPYRLFALTVSDDYGFFSTIMSELVTHLPVHAVDQWDERLVEAERSLGPTKDWDRDWKKRAKADRIIGLRQAIADCRHDVDAFIFLEKSRPDGHRHTTAIADRLCDAGRHSEALEWVRKRGRPGLKAMTYENLADGSTPRDVSDLARTRLEIRILEAMGDRTTAQDLRWKTFEATLDIGMLRDHIARLPDFAEFDVLDKALAHTIGFEQKYRALAFFLNWPRLDLASRLVVDRRAEWEGRHYEVLLAAAKHWNPIIRWAATILYRALLDDILNRARSPAYGHAARYLEKLDALAAHGDAASSIDPHHAYRAALSQKHGRKSGFWSLVKVRK